MAHSEACQLFIEQQIKEGLDEGKTPYSIGKDLADMVQRLFEASIPARTIEQKARRIGRQDATNVANHPTAENHIEIQNNKEMVTCTCGKLYDAAAWDTNKNGGKCPYCWKGLTVEGEPRERLPGAGRPPKFAVKQDDGNASKIAIEAKPEHHRVQFTHENEWYTPQDYVEAARRCLGEIVLDPATSEIAQERIQATNYFTVNEDGLKQCWCDKVWLNPPYAQPWIQLFAEKIITEIDSGMVSEAIVLTHNYTDTAWFHLLESRASLICFTRGRVKFEKSDGTIAAPTQGQAFFYFGANTERFREEFDGYGFIR